MSPRPISMMPSTIGNMIDATIANSTADAARRARSGPADPPEVGRNAMRALLLGRNDPVRSVRGGRRRARQARPGTNDLPGREGEDTAGSAEPTAHSRDRGF